MDQETAGGGGIGGASLEVENRGAAGDDDAYDATAQAEDADRAPEEENVSPLPGDPRPPGEQQPPFKEQY
jgi:hypothetical protein